MDLTQFSKRCVFLPPVKNDYILSQTQQEELKLQLETEFTRLRDSGIEAVLCVGGLNLDYARYDISHILPCIMVYHSHFSYYEEIADLYETATIQSVKDELTYTENKFVFLEELIYNDERNKVLAELQNNPLYDLHINEVDIEIESKLLSRYANRELLTNWLKEQKVLVSYNIQKQLKELKQAFDKNKVGLKIDMTSTSKQYFVCGNLTRENILFK